MTQKFLLLSPRSGREVSHAEYMDFIHSSGLSESQLDQRVLDSPESAIGSLDDYLGIFVGGSPFTVTAPLQDSLWQTSISDKLVNLAKTTSRPMFFTCYGSCLLADALGGVVEQSHPEEVSAPLITLTPEGTHDPICAGLPSPFRALTAHTENVETLPEDSVVLATGEQCPIQMYRIRSTIWVTQFHAEMNEHAMQVRMSHYDDNGYYDPSDVDSVHGSFSGVDTSTANALLSNFVRHCRFLGRT